ncbi:hypothetical protein [Mucilaginibacter phyllosphaerae]|uniref:Uncharacterized protein n=1 Tax=Mucilaginibacter phyllosphaerae TaxID=1812349 RepID=A0A4Y8A9U0_9SPHI|nr:hypothetical protein [Mucilaginibacter phyllosphaerae]MBB3969829.1 hypothetical protein [Mucilaginibacter phyllosphaerae]TEW65204.1 hypothetical protein E2R65_14930 [Mucilaginibacter phyllosphaerae]GGH17297.1 hypothetical protein GCM10007352_27320 [Mucilaginibacter phyllosphaerae]
MKKYLLLLFPVIALCLASCKKDAVDYAGYNVSVNPGNTSTTKTNDSYLPTSKGSSWTYENNLTGTVESTEAHISGVITPINGQNYYEVRSATKGKENTFQYYYVKDKKYKIMATTVQEKVTVEFFLLDDNLKVGDEWTANMSPNGLVNGVPARTVGKIIESGITKTVLNKTYKNVIHTRLTVQYDFGLGSGFEDYGTYDYYLAKEIGLIQTDAELFGFKSSTYLSAYTIK